MRPSYAELHCLSSFTFLRGASQPEELVARAHELGYAALAMTDDCSLAGVVRAHIAAKETGLKLLIGSEIALADGPRLVLLAASRVGYGNLSELISRGRRAAFKGQYRLTRDDLSTGHGAGLPECLALLLPEVEPRPEDAAWLAERFTGRSWLAVGLHCGQDDRARLQQLIDFGHATGLPLVATGDVHMHRRGRRALQDTLTAIRLGVPVAAAGNALYPNGERHLRSLARLAETYPAELLIESVNIAERCQFSLYELKYEYPDELVPAGESFASWLRKLTEIGLARRYQGGAPVHIAQLVQHELALINELGYEPFFLTVADIVTWAKDQHILCQGRGSAANSVVCYALGITEVDPARMSMLFERFISKERHEPPDIDVDFEHERREEVIQYIYRKYGRDRAALAATVISYRPKSAIRDVGKALGFDLARLDHLARNLSWWDGRKVLPERIAECGFDPESANVKRLIALVNELIGFPRHLSQHVGGFVISRGPLARLVPIENAAMAERTVIQWDKDDLDALGLLKVDILALGMLTAIRRALDHVSRLRGSPFGLADVPAEDPVVYDMLCEGDSVGVFQVESRAQMSMLPRLQPREFYDLVIEVAIVRPGPIQGGMVHPYLRRRQKKEAVSYPSDAVKKVLERTLGVPIFQEQVMQLAVAAAGFTPGEADHLRRLMATWRKRGGIEAMEQRLLDGMRERGYEEDFARAIYQQILGFGEYGFPESHSASFALLVYASAWLKRHYPAAFLCALLDSQPMGFYAPAQLIQDARRHGVEVRPVDVTVSGWQCTIEHGAVRLGLAMVKGLAREAAVGILTARAAPFSDVEDMARRAQLGKPDLKCMASAGALATLAGHRRQAHWQAAGAAALPDVIREARFTEATLSLPAPGEGEDLVADYRHLGFTLNRHPLALLRSTLLRLRFETAAQLAAYPDRKSARIAGLVTCRQRPGTASGVVFVTLEDETGNTNVIVHGALVEHQRRELLTARLLGVYGQIQREGNVVHLIAKRLVDRSDLLGQLSVSSRDFH
jgi:error-prone DNA polymerase